ncbi:hypothetical protein C900_01441 [Fulvivirga imtechensis AK7]|uniref:Uncharacterized protein n=1 Tax=Fulvivirga imtechensis AK7 TaxID=1237149 RepID=L8JXQ5_9BACT|nr:hypothetical protein [Fulvivirga imtechensis]ELR73831.1 hypothetical protein C900_01441 [Fulvivirga imtechensis AK7]
MITIQKIKKAINFLTESWRRTDRIEKLYFSENWYDCIAECNKAIDSEKADFFVYYYLGLSQFHLNFLNESTENLELALSNSATKKLNEAIKKYRNYAKYQIACNFRKSRNYEQAISQLNTSIQEDSRYLDFYYLKANIYEDLEKTELAIEAVSHGLSVDPMNKELLEFQKHLAYSYSLEQSEKRNGG